LRLFRIAIKALSRCDKAPIATAENFRFGLKICKSLIDKQLAKSPIFRDFRAEIRLHRKKMSLMELKMTKNVERIEVSTRIILKEMELKCRSSD
jgi:hypothetical protein